MTIQEEVIIEKLKVLIKISDSISLVEYIEHKEDYFDILDTEIKEVINKKAHQLIDDLYLKAKG